VIHNPVFLESDIIALAELVRSRGLNEETKPESKEKLAGRIQLLHEVIEAGIRALRDGDAILSQRGQESASGGAEQQ